MPNKDTLEKSAVKMKFKEFNQAIINIQAFLEERNKLTAVIDVISPTSTGVVEFGGKFLDDYIALLSLAMNDTTKWIEWYIWECDFGTKPLLMTVNNKQRTINSTQRLYDLLTGKYD